MIENNNERRNKIITVTIIGVIVLLIILVGATYAWFSAKSEATSKQVTTAKVDLVVEVNPEATNIKDIKPTTWDTEDMTKNNDNTDIVQIPIKVTNNSTIDVKYDLFITPSGLSLNVEDTDGDGNNLVGGELKDVKYKLYDEKGIEVVTGDFEKENKRQKIVANKNISKKVESSSENIQEYILYIYIENKDEAQNKLQGIDFNIDIEGVTPSEKIAQAILKSEKEKGNIKTDLPQFTADSTDVGLYKLRGDISTSDDGSTKDIYYYRGAVENNYVQFGTYTNDVQNKVYEDPYIINQTVATKGQAILWRIVRINEDGSIKLIAEHNIGLNLAWSSNNKPDYEGSAVKQTVDNWYTETFVSPTEDCEECKNNKDLASLIQDTEFCNDRQDVTSFGSAVRTRLWKNDGNTPPEPTLKCARDEDKVRAKAGLISADEIVYAGALAWKKVTNNTIYYYNKTDFWTISPSFSDSLFYWSYGFLMLSATKVSDSDMAARPVITISADAPFTVNNNDSENAPGTEKNPWIIG